MKTFHEADTTPNMPSPIRNINLGRLLALVSRQHPICGIESEGGEASGMTRLWVEETSDQKAIFFLEFDNETLSTARLSEEVSTRLVDQELSRSRSYASEDKEPA